MSEQNLEITSFLMVGQSNMAGRGELDRVPPIRNPKCFMFRMGVWQHMSEPINPDNAIFEGRYRSGVSLAASFADEYAKHFDENIGLIPCAVGGTEIALWQPGEILFENAIVNARIAMRTSKLGGILWHQGESDCYDFDPDIYARDLLNVVDSFRKTLGNEKLPFVMGEISEDIASKWGLGDNPKKLNALLRSIKDTIPYCELALANDLVLKDDGVHFDAPSCRIFGKRYFDAYMKI